MHLNQRGGSAASKYMYVCAHVYARANTCVAVISHFVPSQKFVHSPLIYLHSRDEEEKKWRCKRETKSEQFIRFLLILHIFVALVKPDLVFCSYRSLSFVVRSHENVLFFSSLQSQPLHTSIYGWIRSFSFHRISNSHVQQFNVMNGFKVNKNKEKIQKNDNKTGYEFQCDH